MLQFNSGPVSSAHSTRAKTTGVASKARADWMTALPIFATTINKSSNKCPISSSCCTIRYPINAEPTKRLYNWHYVLAKSKAIENLIRMMVE